MPSKIVRSKKIALPKSDQKRVRVIAAKTKMSEQAVLEKALQTAQPLLRMITQAARARKKIR
jgi:hypothetical protein